MSVEPIPGERAAIARTGGEQLLCIADYHAGIESVLRAEGVELRSGAENRRERVLGLLAETGADRLIVLGDLVHAIGDPWTAEREEVTALLDAIEVPLTLVKGNHDGEIESVLSEIDHPVTVTGTGGTRIGDVGLVHGHTWPTAEVLEAETVCMGHEHPLVRLEDSVGGSRLEYAWLRGTLAAAPFESAGESVPGPESELVVFPAFNERSGGTWVNVDGQEFLSPFLPDGLRDGQVYLLDGTRLGRLDAL